MPDPIIEAIDISKKYRLGKWSSGSLRQDLKAAWLNALGREDDFFKATGTKNAGPAELWALRHVNLQVMEGEILGIVGPNGAGKST
ncbi:MAG TPA: ATP-binding cassette domain-containing protein, partial [Ferruginibacter sp.]|nr:ATP-binding cassette domain-containing protein [Ferruginibacter sp.]